jgi:hypothetical protein
MTEDTLDLRLASVSGPLAAGARLVGSSAAPLSVYFALVNGAIAMLIHRR